MTRSEKSKELLTLLLEIREKIDQLFYYSESEDLQRRAPGPKQWSIAEIFYHLNRYNNNYLEPLEAKMAQKSATGDGYLEKSWAGKWLHYRLGRSEEDKLRFRLKSPPLLDPLVQKAQGKALVEQVIFRDLVSDLDRLQAACEQLAEKPLDRFKLASPHPLLQVSGAEALSLMLQHSLRHLAQAQKILGG